jgi:hypothetical protein
VNGDLAVCRLSGGRYGVGVVAVRGEAASRGLPITRAAHDTVFVPGEAAESGPSSSLSPVALVGRLGFGKRRLAGVVAVEQRLFVAAA